MNPTTAATDPPRPPPLSGGRDTTGDAMSMSMPPTLKRSVEDVAASSCGASANTIAKKPRNGPPTNVAGLFTALSAALDDVHDRRERIVKISRDITIESKRTISLLHRIAGSQQHRPTLLAQAHTQLNHVVALFAKAAGDLSGNDFYKHCKSIGAGMEEFIEAVAFLTYIEHTRLVTPQEVQDLLVHPTTHQPIIPVTPTHYILGIADLAGEIMRYAINTVARGNTENDTENDNTTPHRMCAFLRALEASFVQLDFDPARGKMPAMKASVAKVEKACYTLKVRGAELPPAHLRDLLLHQHVQSTTHDHHAA
ncbi:Translin [Powellomyces hirtus]|nr:Translin [Powellomyces hirtus]